MKLQTPVDSFQFARDGGVQGVIVDLKAKRAAFSAWSIWPWRGMN